MKKILLAEDPDGVQTHNLMGIGFGISRVIQKLGIKHTHILHDVQLAEPSGVVPWNQKKDKWHQRCYIWIMKKRMGRPDEVVVLSEFMKRFYQERGFFPDARWDVEKPEIINHKSPPEADAPLVHKIINDPPRFLFVGSLVKHKGIELLMQAWEQIGRVRNEASLHIAGDGPWMPKVKKWSRGRKNVFIYGRAGKRELEKIYQNSDVLIFPSICIENRPTVILEALEHGLKIIASETGGVREFTEEEDMLVEPGNVEELKDSIIKILNIKKMA